MLLLCFCYASAMLLLCFCYASASKADVDNMARWWDMCMYVRLTKQLFAVSCQMTAVTAARREAKENLEAHKGAL
ncbi:hypothetical protein BX070DRAFT_222357 [Coemansia spiralis]|nr:hypothetical protein BX070DRAFT_222326 [Coemansia spiralis]KAI9504540.1 hypothetical protein BX070DRAFT_222357 [Coemansia spiralis]